MYCIFYACVVLLLLIVEKPLAYTHLNTIRESVKLAISALDKLNRSPIARWAFYLHMYVCFPYVDLLYFFHACSFLNYHFVVPLQHCSEYCIFNPPFILKVLTTCTHIKIIIHYTRTMCTLLSNKEDNNNLNLVHNCNWFNYIFIKFIISLILHLLYLLNFVQIWRVYS